MVDAACMAASASTSHRALDTEAAAANRAEKAGKAVTARASKNTPIGPDSAKTSIKGSSTMAAVAAAHTPDKADVKGRIAADRAP